MRRGCFSHRALSLHAGMTRSWEGSSVSTEHIRCPPNRTDSPTVAPAASVHTLITLGEREWEGQGEGHVEVEKDSSKLNNYILAN